MAIMALWQQWRPAGFAGFGALPCAGGSGDQPADLMAAFQHCSRVAAMAKPAPDQDG